MAAHGLQLVKDRMCASCCQFWMDSFWQTLYFDLLVAVAIRVRCVSFLVCKNGLQYSGILQSLALVGHHRETSGLSTRSHSQPSEGLERCIP